MSIKKYLGLGSLLVALTYQPLVAQTTAKAPKEAPDNWQHMNYSQDHFRGVSADKVYSELLAGKSSKTVIVAIIDSGVDYDHEDLKDVMWVNADEIPGNGIDDDKNGYVDDIHGWNFIGGKNGEIGADNLELTRLYRKYHEMYANVDGSKLGGKKKKEYAKYMEYKENYDKNRNDAIAKLTNFETRQENMLGSISKLQAKLGKRKLNANNIEKIDVGDDEGMATAKQIVIGALASGKKIGFHKIKENVSAQFQGAIDYFTNQRDAYYNADFDPRHIVGDNYADSKELYYGNNTYDGPDASHGTHVAGIVAATRGNKIGMNGLANNVKIMTVRAVPDGDERDKDVASAIRYAVDNGASIINMSFGKGFSWDKKVVDKAVKYATKKDVLLVHAAGNSSLNTDIAPNFPQDAYAKKGLFGPKTSKTWIEVGALSWKDGADMPATFSNYAKSNVDLFAPGVDIYSTIPDDGYAKFSGTSMASPVVAGVAAILRSYYPSLTAAQVKTILEATSEKSSTMVNVPGTSAQLPFSELSKSGGMIDSYKAVQIAEKTKGKKK